MYCNYKTQFLLCSLSDFACTMLALHSWCEFKEKASRRHDLSSASKNVDVFSNTINIYGDMMMSEEICVDVQGPVSQTLFSLTNDKNQ